MRKILISLIALFAIHGFAQEETGEGGRREHRGPPPMSEEMRAAFEACQTETGVAKPERGQRPSDDDRKLMEDCLKGKGFERPQHQGPGGKRPPRKAQGIQ